MVYRKTERSARVREDTQRRLLGAARKLFAERGYDLTTMQDVVREARSSIGNAYFYYPSKEELLRSLLREATDVMWSETEELASEVRAGEERVAAVLYVNMRRNLGQDSDIVSIALEGPARVVNFIVELRQAKVLHLLIENFPERPTPDLQLAAVYLVGANRTAMEQCVRGRLDVTTPEVSSFLVESNLRVLRLPETRIAKAMRTAVELYEWSIAGQSSKRKARGK
jgi:AcrR family transcriptional regulator